MTQNASEKGQRRSPCGANRLSSKGSYLPIRLAKETNSHLGAQGTALVQDLERPPSNGPLPVVEERGQSAGGLLARDLGEG